MNPTDSRAKIAEADLVARIRAGDEDACATLVRDHSNALLAVARRFLRCEAESADAVQETFILAFRALGSFKGSSTLSSWLHRIVVNRCLGRLRSRKRRRMQSLDALRPAFDIQSQHARRAPASVPAAENPLVCAEMRAQVRACIEQLPDAYRKVLVLRDIEEFDTDQTAERLGSTPGAVRTRLHRARQVLRSLLEPIFCPAAHC
jgi:RNA polymerase sigma-70 factor (ECF subfamily)